MRPTDQWQRFSNYYGVWSDDRDPKCRRVAKAEYEPRHQQPSRLSLEQLDTYILKVWSYILMLFAIYVIVCGFVGFKTYGSYCQIGLLSCQEKESKAWTSNCVPQIPYDVITCPCPSYLLLAHKTLHEGLSDIMRWARRPGRFMISMYNFASECLVWRFMGGKTTIFVPKNICRQAFQFVYSAMMLNLLINSSLSP